MKRLEKLRARLRAIAARAAEIVSGADTDDRELTAEEQAEIATLSTENATITGEIHSLEQAQALEDSAAASAGRRAAPIDPAAGPGGPAAAPTDPAPDPEISGGAPAAARDRTFGFRSFGEFAVAVRGAALRPSAVDPRLEIAAAAASTYGSEAVGEDGGFLVAPAFSSEIWQHVLEGSPVLPLTDNTPLANSNAMTFPRDETTPWGTDGVRAYWEDEADAATATKPKFGLTSMRLKKLMALVPLTDELLADVNALEGYVQRKAETSIRWKAEDALFNGNGAGRPRGIANAGALVSQAKETSQTADTINANNIAKMFARMPADAMGSARWYINPDAFNQLITMTVGNAPIWTPPASGMQGSPAGLLLGRPVHLHPSCKTLGDLGDIYFVSWAGYRTITKAGGIATATSIHLYFDADQTAFRATFRIDGEPSYTAAISPANGSTTLSHFITLAARA